jgi:hypothetical protein
MDHSVEKLLYSRRDTAEALSLSIRSIDYLITTGRLPTRRVGGKILIPAGAVRRFAREDHPDFVRFTASNGTNGGQHPPDAMTSRFEPQRERLDDSAPVRANSRR